MNYGELLKSAQNKFRHKVLRSMLNIRKRSFASRPDGARGAQLINYSNFSKMMFYSQVPFLQVELVTGRMFLDYEYKVQKNTTGKGLSVHLMEKYFLALSCGKIPLLSIKLLLLIRTL